MIKLTIITRCSRINNLIKVKNSIFTTDKFDISWKVMIDSTILKDVDAETLADIQSSGGKIFFIRSIPGDFGHQMVNKAIEDTEDGFIFVLDDDNLVHEDFYESLYEAIISNIDKKGFVYNQKVGGKDFSGVDIRMCSPENMKVSKIDMAQVVLHRELISNIRINPMNYIADSIFIEEVYTSNPDQFVFINKTLCYYNYLQIDRRAKVPRILFIGDSKPELKSNKRAWWESDDLEVLYRKNDESLNRDIKEFDPDFILSSENPNHINLINASLDIKKRWIHLNTLDPQAGEIVYNSSMNYILENSNKMVSFFTPIYNVTDKLIRLYESISKQTYTNWEWILMNDSSDGGKTLKVAESIAMKDHRVKVYDFREKSKGVIGESKYRAAMMCKGYILAEIDHDDYILPHSAQVIVDAFEKFPDAGFAYTDCVEITEDYRTLTYGDGFCFGYGKYRKEMEMGIMMDVNISPNINPKTIRHIVGVPNHIRAWKRDTYLKVGGHNRRLSIADDYELIIRTFLETKFIRIVKNCYLQFIYNSNNSSNTHDLSRADIQRRVRSIADFYNFKIYQRFKELGVDDWAYNENNSNPLLAQSRFGEEECPVNYDYYPDQEISHNPLPDSIII